MSELKATHVIMVYDGEIYEDFGTVPCTQLYYRKDEADKVIAEKDAEIAELKGQVNGFQNRSNLWHYNAVEEHKKLVQAGAVIAEKDKEIAKLKEQYKDMDVTHTVHIAKMNAKIAQLEDDVAFWKAKAKGEM